MSDFSTYFHCADETARKAFKEYSTAIERMKEAETRRKQYPQRFGVVEAEYGAKSARAEADYREAVQKVDEIRLAMTEGEYAREMAEHRAALAEAVRDAFTANPEDIDERSLELLKSGILSATEFESLMHKAVDAENHTMVRIIGRYAESAAAARVDDPMTGNDDEARQLRAIGMASKGYDGRNILDSFDSLTAIYSMCAKNPSMVSSWDELTSPVIASFEF